MRALNHLAAAGHIDETRVLGGIRFRMREIILTQLTPNGALDSFARDGGIRIVRYVTAEEIIQAPARPA